MIKKFIPARSAGAGEMSGEQDAVPATGVAAEKDDSKYDLLDDCRMMLRFAVKEGVEPDESLRKDIAALDGILLTVGEDPISELPPRVAAVNRFDLGKIVIDEKDLVRSMPSSTSPHYHEHEQESSADH